MNRLSWVPGNNRWTTQLAKPQTVHKSICWELTTCFKIRGYLTGFQWLGCQGPGFLAGIYLSMIQVHPFADSRLTLGKSPQHYASDWALPFISARWHFEVDKWGHHWNTYQTENVLAWWNTNVAQDISNGTVNVEERFSILTWSPDCSVQEGA